MAEPGLKNILIAPGAAFPLLERLSYSQRRVCRNRTGRVYAMEQYEIRILGEGQTARVYPHLLASDHAAIRRGQTMANGQERFEVWRGDACVYTQPAGAVGAHI